ncbi:MAG: nickel pincer cofactor biosynthesis protein LarB [Nitrososphaerales archaeon]
MKLSELLRRVAKQQVTIAEAEKLLRLDYIQKVEDLAALDLNRERRRGIPEVIFAEGKSEDSLTKIIEALLKSNGKVIVTRSNEKQMQTISAKFGKKARIRKAVEGGTLAIRRKGSKRTERGGTIGVLTAGTSDRSVAEEAIIVAEEMGCRVIPFFDVGVAGVHRLFPEVKKLTQAECDAIIVIAGMEGALPSVVAGLVEPPVIGVPTSQGYGFGEKGLGALMSMLQSCSLGLAVVNIDNGAAAGAIAALIAQRANSRSSKT